MMTMSVRRPYALVLNVATVAALSSHASSQIRLVRETPFPEQAFEVPATGPDGSQVGFALLGADNMVGNAGTGRWAGIAAGQANGSSSANRAILTGVGADAATIRAVVLEGNPSPEGGAFTFNLYDQARISGNGNVAFASFWGPSLQSWGVYSVDAATGTIHRQIGSGDSLPGFRNVALNRFVEVVGMTDDGRAATLATSLQNLPGGTSALLLGTEAIAVSGVTPLFDPAGASRGAIGDIIDVQMNSSGRYILQGEVTTNGATSRGLIRDGVVLAQQGDQLGDGLISSFGAIGINDRGDWVGVAETTSGDYAVFSDDGILLQSGDPVRRLDGTAAGTVTSIVSESVAMMVNGAAIVRASVVDEFGDERRGVVRSDGRLLLLEGDRVVTNDVFQSYFVGSTPLGAIVGDEMLVSTLLRDQNGAPATFAFIAVTIPSPGPALSMFAFALLASRRRR